MDILFATHNQAKIKLYKNLFVNTKYNILSLNDINVDYEVEEDGKNPVENANKKAKGYSAFTSLPVIADDTGLFFDNISENLQPGVHVRRINGKTVTDEEAIEYYSRLINQNGVELTGRWVKSLAIAIPNIEQIFNFQYNVEKIFTNKINEKRNPGFPLDSISITPEYNKYTVDLTPEENESILKLHNSKVYEYIISILETYVK